jgi:hypothetical protein
MTVRSLPAVLLVAGLALAGPGDDPYSKLPATVSALLDEADSVELLSIDPGERISDPSAGFHGWKVLGRTTLRNDAGRRAIVLAIQRGVGEADDAAGCFEPRHGLRATKGNKVVDFVICFSCRWIEVHDGGQSAFVRTTASAKPAINRALRDAAVVLAQDSEGP